MYSSLTLLVVALQSSAAPRLGIAVEFFENQVELFLILFWIDLELLVAELHIRSEYFVDS